MLLKILLVVFFRRIEFFCLCYLSMNFFVFVFFGLLQALHGFYCCFFLRFIMIKYCRAVLGSNIGALPVELCWIMKLPKPIQQTSIRYLLWVKFYFYCF